MVTKGQRWRKAVHEGPVPGVVPTQQGLSQWAVLGVESPVKVPVRAPCSVQPGSPEAPPFMSGPQEASYSVTLPIPTHGQLCPSRWPCPLYCEHPSQRSPQSSWASKRRPPWGLRRWEGVESLPSSHPSFLLWAGPLQQHLKVEELEDKVALCSQDHTSRY